jgi:acyl-CoA synthetase (AMP-forming)/AMP-acid ligase II
MFDAQVELIRATYDIRPGEVDLPLLPLFALFNPALGMTTVVPEIDPSRPATVDPRKIIQAIRQEGVTSSFGSPTLWRKIAVHCQAHHVELPTLRRVLCAGAPVPPDLWDLMTPVLTHGTLHSPYGATEALPVSSISAPEVHAGTAAATARGAGTCVGHPLAANQVKIIALTDAPLATLADTRELPAGQIGEIIVRGPTVTQTYDGLPEATAAAKIGVGRCGNPIWQIPNPKCQIPNATGQIPKADCAAAALKFKIPKAGPDAGGIASGQIPNSMGQIPNHRGQNPNPNYTGFDATDVGAATGICDLEFGICAPVAGVLPASSAVADDAGWHRMGDLGYLDAEGRLWFCGRKAERVETPEGPLYTEQIEPLFNTHAKVRRCALIGLGERGRQRAALVVEPNDGAHAETSDGCRPLARELRELAKTHPNTTGIKTFFFLKKLPVDVRHNAKIHRLSLARWALTAKGYESDPKR